jgi:hypothetical protein
MKGCTTSFWKLLHNSTSDSTPVHNLYVNTSRTAVYGTRTECMTYFLTTSWIRVLHWQQVLCLSAPMIYCLTVALFKLPFVYTIPSVSHSLHCSQSSCTGLQCTFCQFLFNCRTPRTVQLTWDTYIQTDRQTLPNFMTLIIHKGSAIRTAGNMYSQTGSWEGTMK